MECSLPSLPVLLQGNHLLLQLIIRLSLPCAFMNCFGSCCSMVVIIMIFWYCISLFIFDIIIRLHVTYLQIIGLKKIHKTGTLWTTLSNHVIKYKQAGWKALQRPKNATTMEKKPSVVNPGENKRAEQTKTNGKIF